MIPKPQGFALVVEPVEREKIENLSKELEDSSNGGFGAKVIKGFDNPCLLRVVAAGPGLMWEQGFIANHIGTGDLILGTLTEMGIAKDFADQKAHWIFDEKKYVVINSREYSDITNSALFIVQKATRLERDYDL